MKDQPTYRCWTKATDRESGAPRRSFSWAMSRRAWLEVFPDRMQCGDWVIHAETITAATLYQARQMFIPVEILSVETADRTYQFGLNPWCRIATHLPFQFTRERITLKMSRFSILVRIAAAAYLVYLAFRWLY